MLCPRPTDKDFHDFEKLFFVILYLFFACQDFWMSLPPFHFQTRCYVPAFYDFFLTLSMVIVGSSLPCKVKTSFSSEGGNTPVEGKSEDVTPKPKGRRNDQQLVARENLAIVKPIISLDDKRDNHQADTPTLRFAPDIAKNEMTDAEHKIKLRQQYQANMAAFAEKEIEKEKKKESATELISKEEENKVVAVTLEETNDTNDKPLSKKEVQFQLDEEKKDTVEKEVVYRIVGFGSVDHISRQHKESGIDAKKTQIQYTLQYVKSTGRPGSSQSILKERQLERGLLSFKPVASKHVLCVEKKEIAEIKPASRQTQTTGMVLKQQQNLCNLPSIRTGPKKVSWADPNPRQTCMVKPLPKNNITQRNPPMPKAFLTALPNSTAQIKRYFHAPYQLSNSKLPKR